MKHLLVCVLLLLSSVSAMPKTVGFPQEDISQVISEAKAYVQKERIDVSNYFVQRVEFKNQYDEYHPQFWEVVFLKVPAVKGGHLIVRVYNDAEVDHTFGE